MERNHVGSSRHRWEEYIKNGTQTSVEGNELDLFEPGQGHLACIPEDGSELPYSQNLGTFDLLSNC